MATILKDATLATIDINWNCSKGGRTSCSILSTIQDRRAYREECQRDLPSWVPWEYDVLREGAEPAAWLWLRHIDFHLVGSMRSLRTRSSRLSDTWVKPFTALFNVIAP
jgi:hypothetical protein